MLRRAVLLMLFLAPFLLGPVGSAKALFESRDDRLGAIRSIGIIVAVGDQFTFAKSGLGTDRSSRSIGIGEWGVDEAIAKQVGELVGRRFQVTPVTWSRSAFFADSGTSPGFSMFRGDRFAKRVQSEVQPQGLDAYIVITKARVDLGAGGRKVDGLGLITFRTLMETYTALHAFYEIRVIDGRSFDVIEEMTAGPLAADLRKNHRLAGPARLYEGSVTAVTDAGDAGLHRAILDLIAQSLPMTLESMHLR
ncbi:MAG: hypothetical protein FWD68_06665 [Alphaproteobacteria bacterium]|nr:hypothetical protein [Alphaproteobacteria bacterium]